MMTIHQSTQEKLMTEKACERLGKYQEVINGKPHKQAFLTARGVFIKGSIYSVLADAARQQQSGYVFGSGLVYYVWMVENRIKHAFVPAASFIRRDDFPEDFYQRQNYRGVPNLAVELIAPRTKAALLMWKVQTYLERGTEEVWAIYPEAGVLHQYFRDQPDNVRVYRGSAAINADAFFPGVSIVIADLFKLPELE